MKLLNNKAQSETLEKILHTLLKAKQILTELPLNSEICQSYYKNAANCKPKQGKPIEVNET